MAFSGFQDFNPDFSNALQRMISMRPGISINSGYRTPEHQAELFADAISKYGSVAEARRHVAPAPGTYNSQGSRHNFGLAADLAYASPEDKAWAHAHAKELGLNFRLYNEDWHIELLNGKPEMVANNSPISGSGSSDSSGSGAGYLPPRPERAPRYKDEDPFIPLPAKTDFSIGNITDTQTLINMLSPKRTPAQELLKKIRSFNV